MIARFWGVRGSIPSPIASEEIAAKIERAVRRSRDMDLHGDGAVRQFMDDLPWYTKGTYGGNTPCVEVESGNTLSRIVFDAGSGFRPLGLHLMEQGFSDGKAEVHLFLSHTHWDHIQGLPFFAPAYVPGNRITIYSAVEDMEERLVTQQAPAFFPVSMKDMPAGFDFVPLAPDQVVQIGDVHVGHVDLHHPGGSYAFRAQQNDHAVVYASDTEFTDLSEIDVDKYLSFFSKAGALIFDSQYFLSEAMEKEDWGHSPSLRGVDLAYEAGVRTLVLFHHEPTYNDRTLWELLKRTEKYAEMRGIKDALEIVMAYEGLALSI